MQLPWKSIDGVEQAITNLTWAEIYDFSKGEGYDPGSAAKLKKVAKKWIKSAKDFEEGHGFTGGGKQRTASDAEAALIDMNRYLKKMKRGDENADIMVSWAVS